jgi:hypothetical protein
MKLTTAINSNKRFSYNKYTDTEKNKGWYRAMLDHILISERSYGRIIKAKYQENTTILSDHLASLIRLKTEPALCKKLKISERDQKANNQLRFNTETIKKGNPKKSETETTIRRELSEIQIQNSNIEDIKKEIANKIKKILGTKNKPNGKKKWIFSTPKLNMIKEVKSKLTKCQHIQNKEKGLLLTGTACNKIKQNCHTFENIEFSLIKSLNKNTLKETCHKLLKKVNIAQKKTTKEIQSKIIKQKIKKNNKDLIENPKFFYHRLFGAQNITKEIVDGNNIIQTNPEICIELIHKW